MPFRILKIKFPKGAWRKPLFYIQILGIIINGDKLISRIKKRG